MTTLEMASWAVIGLGGTSLLYQLIRQIGAHAQSRTLFRQDLAVLEERLKLVRAATERRLTQPAAWNGIRKFSVREKREENGGICSFYLTPHDGKLPLPEFQPGQFLTFHVPIDGSTVTRCYSLSDAPNPDYYRVSIKRCLPPPDRPEAPPGVVSSYFHDAVDENDILDVLAPRGKFAIDPFGESPLVLTGGGVGVTPVLSMMKSLMAMKPRRETWFFYGIRNGTENMIADEIDAWRALALPNVHVQVCYSEPRPGEVKGRDYDHEGWISVDLFKELLPSNNYQFFTCGPGPMMEAIRGGLEAWGVPEEHVHDEAFIAAKKAVEVEAASVGFRKSGKTIEIGGSATSLLDLASEAGIDIPSGCCAGSCGSCQTAVLSGKVHYDRTPEFPVESGSCLPCVCLPDGDLELDA